MCVCVCVLVRVFTSYFETVSSSAPVDKPEICLWHPKIKIKARRQTHQMKLEMLEKRKVGNAQKKREVGYGREEGGEQ